MSLESVTNTIRERVGEILDALPVGETFDWVPAVSVELTSRMLATLFDVPQADRHRLIGWSNTISNADDPAYVTDVAQFWEALADCGDYFAALWAHKQQHPGVFDLLTMLSQSTATRDMDARQLLGNIILLLVGGNDTTRNSISGSVLALNDFPAEYEKLRASFLDTLLAAAEKPWLTLIFTLRADFYGNVLEQEAFSKRVDAGLVNVLPMTQDERRTAIEQPALQAGRSFESGLVERILAAVEAEGHHLDIVLRPLPEGLGGPPRRLRALLESLG